MKNTLTENERNFLLSVKQGEPNYELLSMTDLNRFPGLQWKLLNIRNMDQKKHLATLRKLQNILLG